MRFILCSRIKIAARLVAVDGPDGLQIGIDDRAADEAHTPPVQVAGDAVGQGVGGLVVFDEDVSAGEGRQVGVEGAEFRPDLLENRGIADSGAHLQPVADDVFFCFNYRNFVSLF